ncbi:MAG TPA: aspartate--ammonia ligase [Thermotogota bacterium]|nr:aspartate--ammonia ligase [Thermotogota bacterium]HPJ87907.1 aspartate--ammonia ligase [Thermotogota bacterium]HPR95000.1 aspartate--ammonia ligase [Thermotogota bacterium]
MDLLETEVALKKLKDYFERALTYELHLTRVSAPLFVQPETGLNDNLNGVEEPVSFTVKDGDTFVEIVHSLAKWKRNALKRYNFSIGEGLYTDMNAIRKDEELDNLHSIYVDQWDWEKIIAKADRTEEKLKEIVRSIFRVFKSTESYITFEYKQLDGPYLPEEITFITTQELEDMYPDLTPKEREDRIAREKKAVFIQKIGGRLKSGIKHDGRAPDYDDWELNGDIVFYYPLFDSAFEMSSMGIRVDEDSLKLQLGIEGCSERLKMDFHKDLMEGKLPYTVGGGIGQSRICMYFLQKAHIGEVQSSIWPSSMIQECEKEGIILL